MQINANFPFIRFQVVSSECSKQTVLVTVATRFTNPSEGRTLVSVRQKLPRKKPKNPTSQKSQHRKDTRFTNQEISESLLASRKTGLFINKHSRSGMESYSVWVLEDLKSTIKY